jgi:hypothetical protein
MKKFIVLGLSLLASMSVFAGEWKTQSFINGHFLLTPINGTIGYGYTNVIYIDGGNQLRWSFSTNSVAPTLGILNSTNFIVTQGAHGMFWTNFSAYSSTNATAGGSNTYSTIYNPGGINDVSTFADANGNVWANAAITVFVPATNNADFPSAAFTATGQLAGSNTMTLVFNKVTGSELGINGQPTYQNGLPYVATGDNFIITVNCYGTNYYLTTNVPTAFLQGARKIRLTSLSTTSGTSANMVKEITLSGWVN